jgi:hypothetical protein
MCVDFEKSGSLFKAAAQVSQSVCSRGGGLQGALGLVCHAATP